MIPSVAAHLAMPAERITRSYIVRLKCKGRLCGGPRFAPTMPRPIGLPAAYQRTMDRSCASTSAPGTTRRLRDVRCYAAIGGSGIDRAACSGLITSPSLGPRVMLMRSEARLRLAPELHACVPKNARKPDRIARSLMRIATWRCAMARRFSTSGEVTDTEAEVVAAGGSSRSPSSRSRPDGRAPAATGPSRATSIPTHAAPCAAHRSTSIGLLMMVAFSSMTCRQHRSPVPRADRANVRARAARSSGASPCSRRPSLPRSRCVASRSLRPRLITVRCRVLPS